MSKVWFLQQDVSSVALTQAPPLPCSIAVTEVTPGLDWVHLRVITPGQNCSFTLTSLDSGEDGGECRRTRGATEEGGSGLQGGEGEEAGFVCTLDHLEAGTSYQLQIRSQMDERVENVSVATSKSRPSIPPRSTALSCVYRTGPSALWPRTLQRTCTRLGSGAGPELRRSRILLIPLKRHLQSGWRFDQNDGGSTFLLHSARSGQISRVAPGHMIFRLVL